MQVKKLAACLLFGFLSLQVKADSNCPEHYFRGTPPVFINKRLKTKTREVCYMEFAVMHSGMTKTPLLAAEYLTTQRLEEARGLRRVNAFHAEENLPANERANLSEYIRSGFDRGHLAPSADMSISDAQYESFSLANIIPQDPDNNQNLWESIESATRALALKRGEIFVMTGVAFKGEEIQRLNGRVFVPTHIYKAIYDPRTNEGAAYLVENQPKKRYEIVSLGEIEEFAGINLFPDVADEVKSNKMYLPKPKSYRERQREKYGRSGQ